MTVQGREIRRAMARQETAISSTNNPRRTSMNFTVPGILVNRALGEVWFFRFSVAERLVAKTFISSTYHYNVLSGGKQEVVEQWRLVPSSLRSVCLTESIVVCVGTHGGILYSSSSPPRSLTAPSLAPFRAWRPALTRYLPVGAAHQGKSSRARRQRASMRAFRRIRGADPAVVVPAGPPL